ncbi:MULTISPECIES: HNH endonuclease [Streptomyces]|uniref:HNH endonuclease signature motif containing protein n=1 Tax=Streptomyces acidiscabies TaxID=42234 RepID=A0AAP6ELH9_9ACTN|nr:MULTISPECIES: HNH endonuclease signature motif containing protein [Streptomyces]MBZ3918189.1 HNH endonuclease [Streptomyces acidiscabies]MDX2967129.1 HNH endonuclease signature motif containing protein [Streptomyces acidiscabies]MDX3788348.1 HNH endonuclease signature motif containing protein [Streptomyces acidiscabies]
MATDRSELTSYEFRQLRARILAASDICIVCGHGHADAVDHIRPVAKGGARLDPDNLAPIHGVNRCPTCLRSCNSEKSDRPLADVVQLVTSVDWFAGP